MTVCQLAKEGVAEHGGCHGTRCVKWCWAPVCSLENDGNTGKGDTCFQGLRSIRLGIYSFSAKLFNSWGNPSLKTSTKVWLMRLGTVSWKVCVSEGECVLVEVCECVCVYECACVYVCECVCWVGCLDRLASSSRCMITSGSEYHTPCPRVTG